MADKNRRISFLLFYYIILFFLIFFLLKIATTRVQIADDTLSLPFILQYKKH